MIYSVNNQRFYIQANNKPFTNMLRNSLKEEFADDPDKTYVYYDSKYSERMIPFRSKYYFFGKDWYVLINKFT